ncbi:MAG TPA: alpha/beta hydrolase [Blastocatellia bacterium]|nr:alpha/beta hydrolase [Blastocatellia bacterium]
MLLNTENGPLYFETVGSGPPLVFSSGWAMTAECWRPTAALLGGRYRCLLYDARGVGRSQPVALDARFELKDHADDLHRILEAAQVFDAVLVGHDVGALVAAQLAAMHPQDARAMVVVSPRPGLPEDDVKNLGLFTPAQLALRELAAFPLIRNIVTRRFYRAPRPWRDRLSSDFAALSPRAAYETALAASSFEAIATLERAVGESAAPALFVCGEKDKKGTAEARRLFALSKAGKLATLRGCGFLPMLEYPKQFAKLIDDFAAIAAVASPRALSHR